MENLPSNTRRSTHNALDFRPRYPLDPFVNREAIFSPPSGFIDLHDPWLLNCEHLPTSQAPRRDVILVLGTPVDGSLDSFLCQPSLSHSLVIIATHQPPTISSSYTAVIRILQLHTPLVVQDLGAVRLVTILEWAERIARIWRTHGAHGANLLLFDEPTMADPAAVARIVRASPGSALGSSLSLGKGTSKLSILPKRISLFLSRRKSSPSPETTIFRHSQLNLPRIDPAQKPFDAIINYVLDHVTDKKILKQTILITSITRPFLSSFSQSRTVDSGKDTDQSKRASFVRQSLYSLSPFPRYQSGDSLSAGSSSLTVASSASVTTSSVAHMIHILPQQNRPNLIRSLDSFLSSYSISNVDDDSDHAKQYIMHGSTLCEIIRHAQDKDLGQWTVADLIFQGLLDDIRGKAWIGSGDDILLPSQIPSSLSPIPRFNITAPRGRSVTQYTYPSTPRGQVVVSRATSSADTTDNHQNGANPTPPPSPRSKGSALDQLLPSNPAPALLKPIRSLPQTRPRPLSEAVYGNTRTVQVSASPRTLSVGPTALQQVPRSTRVSLPASTVSKSVGVMRPDRRGSNKTLQRSKLNLMVHPGLEEQVTKDEVGLSVPPLPSPPASDSSGDYESKVHVHASSEEEVARSGKVGKKSSLKFWKSRRDAVTP